jgi:hypothetical protein
VTLLNADLQQLNTSTLSPGVEYPDPRWWVYMLEHELTLRYPLVRIVEDYYEGRHRLNFATSKFREVFGEMLAAVSDNWMPLIVKASAERLRVQGFHVPEAPSSRLGGFLRRRLGGTQTGDQHAWEIWQRNGLDVGAPMGFTEAIKHGEAYLMAWWDEEDDQYARITVEHPSQVVVARANGDWRRRSAALKKWQEDDGSLRATLYLPDEIRRYRRDEGAQTWEPLSDGQAVVANPLGVVPVIPIVNDPHMLPVRPPRGLMSTGPDNGTIVSDYAHVGLGRSDIVDAISTQDSINKLVCDMLVASEVGAFRQRWATGLEVPVGEDGKPKEPFESAINRLWISPDDQTKFGEFAATELSNFVTAIENRVSSLASRTRTPAHYLLAQSGSFPSGESLKASETGLVAKVKDKQGSFSESLEEALRLAFRIEGQDARAAAAQAMQTSWETAESRSESEYVDSLVKKLALGVPPQQLWQDAGYSPQEIERFRELLVEYASYQDVSGHLDPARRPTAMTEPPPAAPATGGAGA